MHLLTCSRSIAMRACAAMMGSWRFCTVSMGAPLGPDIHGLWSLQACSRRAGHKSAGGCTTLAPVCCTQAKAARPHAGTDKDVSRHALSTRTHARVRRSYALHKCKQKLDMCTRESHDSNMMLHERGGTMPQDRSGRCPIPDK
jgi:hypothetical protein